MAEFHCDMCGAAFRVPPKDRKNDLKYCSSACWGKARSTAVERRCETCGACYSARPNRASRFCSRACQIASTKRPAEYTCQHCGRTRPARPSHAARARYCSQSCRATALSVGVVVGVYAQHTVLRRSPYYSPNYRKIVGKVRKRDGYQCRLCGRQFDKFEKGLEVDHRIPVRLGGLDTMENLWALCVPCHRKKDAALRVPTK